MNHCKTSTSSYISASFAALLIGVSGLPIALACGALYDSFIPILLISGGALAFPIVTMKERMASEKSSCQRSMAAIAMVLIYLWAPLLLLASVIAYAMKMLGKW